MVLSIETAGALVRDKEKKDMPKEVIVKIKVIKGTVCGGEVVRPNLKAKTEAEKYPVIDATAKDARLLILTGFAEPADEAAHKLMQPAKR